MSVINSYSRRNAFAVNEIVFADLKWNTQKRTSSSKKRKTDRDLECVRSSNNIDYILRFKKQTRTGFLYAIGKVSVYKYVKTRAIDNFVEHVLIWYDKAELWHRSVWSRSFPPSSQPEWNAVHQCKINWEQFCCWIPQSVAWSDWTGYMLLKMTPSMFGLFLYCYS